MIRLFSQYVSPRTFLLMLVESVITALALVAGMKLRFWNEPGEFHLYTQLPGFLLPLAAFILAVQIGLYYSDFYDLYTIRRRHEQLFCLGQSLGGACVMLAGLYYVFPNLVIGRSVFFISMAVLAIAIMISRLAIDTAWRVAAPLQNVVVLGSHELAVKVANEITRRDDLNIRLVGLIGSTPDQTGDDISGHTVIGSVESIENLIENRRISRIVVAMENRRGSMPVRELVSLRVQGVRVEDAHTTMSALTGRIWLDAVQPSWFIFSEGFKRSALAALIKRTIDIVFGSIGLVLTAPFMLIVMALIRLDSKGPVIYRQTRVGLRGKHFDLMKLRSMRADAESNQGAQWAQKNDPRVTSLGRIMRKYRLDEMPQFINIIRGDMSFVGPRPERPVFVEKLRQDIPYYDERHSVRPGLTGWAQVQYEYGSTFEDAKRKLEYDLFYLINMSTLFDCAIILQTVRILLSGRGAR